MSKQETNGQKPKNCIRLGDVTIGDGIPRICAPITGKTTEGIQKQAGQVREAAPDLVEWRVDAWQGDLSDQAALGDILSCLQEALGRIPLLLTYRSVSEGGAGTVTYEAYSAFLLWAAARREVALLDVEACRPACREKELVERLHEIGKPVLASAHRWSVFPQTEERDQILTRLLASRADIVKFACMTETGEEAWELLSWTRQQKLAVPLVVIGMGEAGKITRVAGHLSGSAITFGSVVDASAPGQLSVATLRELLPTRR